MYRLQVGTQAGEERGYQWRDLDQDLFTSIATGQRPPGDAEAQARDSTEFDSAGQNRTMYYLAVYDKENNQWAEPITQTQAQEKYTAWAFVKSGA